MITKRNNLRHTTAILCVCFFSGLALFSHDAFSACSPGIPCTDYTLTANPTAGTDAALNGKKTGQPAPYTGGTCDGNYMNQIISNAYLGASRELIMSEQLINKPDSVLAYTCFDQLVAMTAHYGGTLSETQTFGADTDPRGFALKAGDDSGGDDYDGDNVSDGEIDPDSGAGLMGVPPPDCTENTDDHPCETYTVDLTNKTGITGSYNERLDYLLGKVVMESLNTYLTSNFNHTYLGGSSSINRTSTAITATSYNCSEMATVWLLSQCADFGEYDRFRTFSDLVVKDPRAFPTGCSPANIADDSDEKVDSNNVELIFPYTISKPCPDADANNTGATANTGITNKQIDLAHNCNYTYADFDIIEPLMSIVKSSALSPISSPTQMAAKAMSGHPILCSDPIPTGVIVISYTHTLASLGPLVTPLVIRYVHYDHVCPNPGCYYIPVKYPMAYVPAAGGTPLNLLNITSVPTVSSTGVCSPL